MEEAASSDGKNSNRDQERALTELATTLAHTQDPQLIKDFLLSILTEYEVGEVATRWALVRLIDGGMSQRSIARALGLSLCKITRGSRELKREDSPFGRMVDAFKGLTHESLTTGG